MFPALTKEIESWRGFIEKHPLDEDIVVFRSYLMTATNTLLL